MAPHAVSACKTPAGAGCRSGSGGSARRPSEMCIRDSHNVLPHDGKVLRVKGHQGRALGRDGMIEVTVTIRDNQPEKVTISGAAVIL